MNIDPKTRKDPAIKRINTKIAVFNDSVRLQNEKFTLYSDTLQYSMETKIAMILGLLVIVSDSGKIYISKG